MGDILTFFKVMLEFRAGGDGMSYNGMSAGECKKKIQTALQHPKVKLLIEQLEKSGCSINPDKFIRGVRCRDRATAGYSDDGIVICCNYLRFQDEVSQGVIHELIHAYDDCRAKNLDWSDCCHRACAELRASHLSGDCHHMRELLRGTANILGYDERECIRRRASASVSAYPKCTEHLTKLALDSVWDICYKDVKPFDKAP